MYLLLPIVPINNTVSSADTLSTFNKGDTPVTLSTSTDKLVIAFSIPESILSSINIGAATKGFTRVKTSSLSENETN